MRTNVWALGILVWVGCSENHVREADGGALPVPDAGAVLLAPDAPAAPPDAPAPVTEEISFCLADGRGLREIGFVDNNDSADHGPLLRFELGPTGLLAAAGEDGTLKLWTLEAELLETFDGTVLTYGPEIPSAPLADLAFDGERVLGGDIRGIVLQMERGGGILPLGGTTPDHPITAIAFDPSSRRLAHAQGGDVPPLTVRTEDGTIVDVTTDVDVADLLFTESGALLVAGTRDGVPVIETRDVALAVSAPDVVLTTPGSFVELARLGGMLAGVTPSEVYLAGAVFPLAGGRSVALTTAEGGTFVLVAGAGGLDVLDADGRNVFHQAGDLVGVRVDPSGRFVVIGGREGTLHVLACAD